MVIAAFQRGGKCTEKSVATQKAAALFKTSSLASSRALCQQLSHRNHPLTAAHMQGRTGECKYNPEVAPIKRFFDIQS